MVDPADALRALASEHGAGCEQTQKTQHGAKYRVGSERGPWYSVWLYNSGKLVLETSSDVESPLYDALNCFCQSFGAGLKASTVTRTFVLDPLRFDELRVAIQPYRAAETRPLQWRGQGWSLTAWDTGTVVFQGIEADLLRSIDSVVSRWLSDITEGVSVSQTELIEPLRGAAASIQPRRQSIVGVFRDGSTVLIEHSGAMRIERGSDESEAAKWIAAVRPAAVFAVGIASNKGCAVAVSVRANDQLRESLRRVERSKLLAHTDLLRRFQDCGGLNALPTENGRQAALRALAASLNGTFAISQTDAAFFESHGLPFVLDGPSSALAQALAQRFLVEGVPSAPSSSQPPSERDYF